MLGFWTEYHTRKIPFN
uniref:Uncharacterized protein n=1 Tax=Arundo donax TaxID=35708 RepID=A0A0A9CKC9_ARUDO